MIATHLIFFRFFSGASTLAAPTGFGGYITAACLWAFGGFGLLAEDAAGTRHMRQMRAATRRRRKC